MEDIDALKPWLDTEGIINPSDYLGLRKSWDEEIGNACETCIITDRHGWVSQIPNRWNFRKVKWLYSSVNHLYNASNISLCVVGFGAPNAAMIMEELIASGSRKFIVFEGTPGLRRDVLHTAVIAQRAIRDEGVSYHYLHPDEEAKGDPEIINLLSEMCNKKNIEHHIGNIWTTEAPYRETREMIEGTKNMGALAVDMMTAALYAVAKFRKVRVAGICGIIDTIDCNGWTPAKNLEDVKTTLKKVGGIVLEAASVLSEEK